MMLAPLRNKAQGRARVSRPYQLPAPTKGWVVGTNIAEAPEGSCYLLENAFPQLNYVRVRGGSAAWATGMGSYAVQTLMPWYNGTTSKLFAACNGSIYDVSSTGAVGAAVLSGLTNSYLNYVQFQGLGSSYLFAVNGVDAPKQWNGSAWSTPSITATGSPVFSNVTTFKNRMFFVENNSLNIWYLATNAVSGTATVFPMQGVFRFGGYILAAGSWAIDSTSGIYDSFVIVTSEGEVAMYDGSDPASWSLKGTYKISKPLGPRCMSKAGGDLMIMTEDGIVPMSKVQTLDQIALQNVAVTQPIQPEWIKAVIERTGLVGWQVTLWSLQSMAIINLPKSSTADRTQFVVNARTGAWARYSGWDANCFAVFNNSLFYGSSDGRVMQAETGSADDGQNYTATIFPSFTSLGGGVNKKQLRLIHPYVTSNFYQELKVTVNVDFDLRTPVPPPALLPPDNGPRWDVALWDVAQWTGALETQKNWQPANGFGVVFAPIIQVTLSSASENADIRLMRMDLLYEDAEIIA